MNRHARIWHLALPALAAACGPHGASNSDTLANRTDRSRCDAGDGSACSRLGMSLWLDARSRREKPVEAMQPMMSACDQGSWIGCAMAARARSDVGQEPGVLEARAKEGAAPACESGSLPACQYLADTAQANADAENAKTYFGKACELVYVPNFEEDGPCREAVRLGVPQAALEERNGARDKPVELSRVEGHHVIHPSNSDAIAMSEKGEKSGVHFVFCLDQDGSPDEILLADSSGFPDWDRRIFEAIRSWRYEVEGPWPSEPVCPSLAFVYFPN